MTHSRLVLVLVGMVLVAEGVLARATLAKDFFVFPLQVSVTVRDVVSGAPSDAVITRTLKEKDIVNLALGRPLGSKVDKKREILAVVVPYYPEDFAEGGRLIVFDPSQNGLAQVTTDVGLPTVIDRELAVLANGTQGLGTITGQVQQTVLGTPASNALHPSTLWLSGAGKEIGHKGATTGIVAGRLSFTATVQGQTTTVNGFIVKGKGKIPVKLIGMFADGTVSSGCGNGIIEPNLGEECEFSDQSACPGNCNACTCNVCGNNRIDPGEICDGTDQGVCPLLGVACRANCEGCEVCGDGVVGVGETCDPGITAPSQCPGSACLNPECDCGCTPGVPETCPGTTCCDPATHRCCEPGKPGCGLFAEACCGGPHNVSSGLCDGLVAPGAACPDRPAGGCFICHVCDGKQISGTCTVSPSVCTFDPLP